MRALVVAGRIGPARDNYPDPFGFREGHIQTLEPMTPTFVYRVAAPAVLDQKASSAAHLAGLFHEADLLQKDSTR